MFHYIPVCPSSVETNIRNIFFHVYALIHENPIVLKIIFNVSASHSDMEQLWSNVKIKPAKCSILQTECNQRRWNVHLLFFPWEWSARTICNTCACALDRNKKESAFTFDKKLKKEWQREEKLIERIKKAKHGETENIVFPKAAIVWPSFFLVHGTYDTERNMTCKEKIILALYGQC